ncbi:hypothetical protein [Caenispirillum bisanense]|uniref:GIY-YIG domain-containing protein n=1 Tax=Caenispirillum bisanense TaxID=414052 RepID=A0A286GNA1_9PROT|nr:hypothetical protein [Caenispirillum bisanense]SOD96464.1 hypothetical protein SAMN05421508_105339 [Caenispirillum bisanense]
MSSLSFLNYVLSGDRPANVPFVWRRSRSDFSWPTLGAIDPVREGLKGVPGVVVVWSQARHGRYIYVGQSRDLAAAVTMLRSDPAVDAYGARQLNVTWAPIGVAHRPGVVAYLRRVLDPAVDRCSLDDRWPVGSAVRPLSVPLPA